MIKKKKKDLNQKDIEIFLKRLPGITFCDLSGVGNGCPDLLVGYKRRNYLFEIKNPGLPPSKRRLTIAEEHFHIVWSGQINIVEHINDIINIIGYELDN